MKGKENLKHSEEKKKKENSNLIKWNKSKCKKKR